MHTMWVLDKRYNERVMNRAVIGAALLGFSCQWLWQCSSRSAVHHHSPTEMVSFLESQNIREIGILSLLPPKAVFVNGEQKKQNEFSYKTLLRDGSLAIAPGQIASLIINQSGKRTYNLQGLPFNFDSVFRVSLNENRLKNGLGPDISVDSEKLSPLMEEVQSHSSIDTLLIIYPRLSFLGELNKVVWGFGVTSLLDRQGEEALHTFISYDLLLIDVASSKLKAKTEFTSRPLLAHKGNSSWWPMQPSKALRVSASIDSSPSLPTRGLSSIAKGQIYSSLISAFTQSIWQDLQKLRIHESR